MAKKKFRFAEQVAVHDPAGDTAHTRDDLGNIVVYGILGMRYVLPGEYVELEEKEGKALEAKVGPYVTTPAPSNTIFIDNKG